MDACQNLQSQVDALQVHNIALGEQATQSMTQAPAEPQIPIPDKFDSDHRKFHGFLNQRHLLFLMHLQLFPTDRTTVGTHHQSADWGSIGTGFSTA